MYLITDPDQTYPADLRQMIENKLGHTTDTAFGELCGVVERLTRLHSHATQRAVLRPLLESDTYVTIQEKQ